MMTPYLSDNIVVVFDLDDTLYKEIEYLYSAYREIADFLLERKQVSRDPYPKMVEWYHQKKNVFQSLNDYFRLEIPIAAFLSIYRNHIPDIVLDPPTEQTLSELCRNECILGIISDGRSVAQRNKIAALGLDRYVQKECIIISEEFGSEKPNEMNYLAIQRQYPEKRFFYVGDNPQKDFLAPNALGWETICLLDDGKNIHKQDFSLPSQFLPHKTVNTINQILRYI